jgi:hypothetical protein
MHRGISLKYYNSHMHGGKEISEYYDFYIYIYTLVYLRVPLYIYTYIKAELIPIQLIFMYSLRFLINFIFLLVCLAQLMHRSQTLFKRRHAFFTGFSLRKEIGLGALLAKGVPSLSLYSTTCYPA